MNWDFLFPPSRDSGAAGSCSDGGPGEQPARPVHYQSPWMWLFSVLYRPALLLLHREEGEQGRGPGLLGPLLGQMRGGPGPGPASEGLEAAHPLGGFWASAWHWVGAAEREVEVVEVEVAEVEEEEVPKSLEASPDLWPPFPGLLSRVCGRVGYPGPRRQAGRPQPLDLSRPCPRPDRPPPASDCPAAACLRRPAAPLRPGFSSLPDSLPLSACAAAAAAERMGKPAEFSRCGGQLGLVTPEPDYGYSSLEEEHTGRRRRRFGYWGRGPPPPPPPPAPAPAPAPAAPKADTRSEGSGLKDDRRARAKDEEAVWLHLSVDSTMPTLDLLDLEGKSARFGDDEWNSNESGSGSGSSSGGGGDESEGDAEEEESYYSLPRPQCSNKTIAYILGSNPSSDEDDSEEDEDEDEESDSDDDGFDSDGSSELSGADELLNSLAGTSDPYNLMNFQACIKTQQKVDIRTAFESGRPQQSVSCTLVLDDDVDRLDSGFSDEVQGELQKAFTQLASGKKYPKKVAFDEQVAVYYVSSEEIRKGPWEEYARDRCRFQKRIRETEECIGYCFTPKHRWTVLEKLRLGS
ncbi:protein phosphatase 1 regulatory subunit 15B [Carcharodon carcharias]|uniref:protein phosphatase 1 regulatory subunit 15B n=1 Tax=Carcharodon carcharias TaxID=13397 RepID=UPI001B7F6302|nr:protein phosphatase 1 regulatory subunit 15B [Carcharodon carcharias]